jgi:hypothetical protein
MVGIYLSSASFSMGPDFTVQTTASLNGTFQINNSIESVNTMLFWFTDERYK